MFTPRFGVSSLKGLETEPASKNYFVQGRLKENAAFWLSEL